jgi:hypothetical protein
MTVLNLTSALDPLGLVRIQETEVHFAVTRTVLALRTSDHYTRRF